ncbi:MAG: hypothetical protein LBF23_01820 [Endomicrobium sp.]|jgi:hypothetical protein|nr:hypothetical protein [Endomicrobium sp.]
MTTKKQLENLKKGAPIFDTEAGSEAGRKGGIKSGQIRREKKLLKDVILDLLYSKSKTDKNKTNQELMVASLFEKALTGDSKAFEVLRDTAGQKPTDKTELTGDLRIQKVFITKKYTKQADKLIDDFINE